MQPSIINPRFGFVEHFSADCSSVCTQPNIDPSVKAACDTGSQSYCSTSDKISSTECKPYLDRVIRTRAAQKTNTQYANSVNIPTSINKTITDYYNALGDAADGYLKANINNLSAASVTDVMNIINAEQGTDRSMALRVTDNAIAQCVTSNAACEDVKWITDRITDNINTLAIKFTNASLNDILSYISNNLAHYTKFQAFYKSINNLIISKLTIDGLNSPTLITVRNKSIDIRNAVDLFVVNYVLGNTLAAIPTTSVGAYDIDISGKPNLYNLNIRGLYKAISTASNGAVDNLATLITNADIANKNRCTLVDVNTDNVCIAMRATGETDLVNAIQNTDSAFCMASSANIVQDRCVAYVNTNSNNATFDSSKAYNLVMSAATKADGSLDKTILDKYPGIKPWLTGKTTDTIQTNSSTGEKTILPVCGTANGLSIDQCKKVCEVYPDLCAQDQIQKCQLPKYRYSTENFSEKNENDSLWFLWLLLIIIVTLIGYYSIGLIRCIRNDNINDLSYINIDPASKSIL